MFRTALLLCLLASGTALAQETAPTVDEQFPVDPAGAQAGEEVRATHGDWQIRCTTGAEPERCVLYQLLVNEAGVPVVELTMLRLPQGNQAIAGVTAVTPLGTILTSGLALQVGGGEARQYPYSWCTPAGCFARFGLDAAGVQQMKSGSEALVALFSVANPQVPVRLNLSLDGFTAAFDELPVAAGGAEIAPAPAAPVIDSPVTGQ